MQSSLRKIKRVKEEETLSELWENALFNNESLNALENVIVSQSEQKNLEDKKLLDSPSKEACIVLSTVRNRNLIDIEEQNLLRKTVVGFFGLSVGSHAALTWIMESRADAIKISDPDTIAPTNLNRLRFGWNDIGRPKVDVVREKLLEINPYLTVVSSKSKKIESFEDLFSEGSEINLVVDAIDNLQGKVSLRLLSKERKIPLISAADVGDNVVLDIERYDLNPQPQPFLGRLGDINRLNFSKLSDLERKKLIIRLVGFEKNSEKMLDSLLDIGKSITTWPQLGATATIAGGVVATTIKKIILGEKVISGRYYISLDDILVVDYNSSKRSKSRKIKIAKVKRSSNLDF